MLIPQPSLYTNVTYIPPGHLQVVDMLTQQLIQFLQAEFAISTHAIAIGLRYTEQTPSLLPMVLWQYGLITIEQLDQVFEWMETASSASSASSVKPS